MPKIKIEVVCVVIQDNIFASFYLNKNVQVLFILDLSLGFIAQ